MGLRDMEDELKSRTNLEEEQEDSSSQSTGLEEKEEGLKEKGEDEPDQEPTQDQEPQEDQDREDQEQVDPADPPGGYIPTPEETPEPTPSPDQDQKQDQEPSKDKQDITKEKKEDLQETEKDLEQEKDEYKKTKKEYEKDLQELERGTEKYKEKKKEYDKFLEKEFGMETISDERIKDLGLDPGEEFYLRDIESGAVYEPNLDKNQQEQLNKLINDLKSEQQKLKGIESQIESEWGINLEKGGTPERLENEYSDYVEKAREFEEQAGELTAFQEEINMENIEKRSQYGTQIAGLNIDQKKIVGIGSAAGGKVSIEEPTTDFKVSGFVDTGIELSKEELRAGAGFSPALELGEKGFQSQLEVQDIKTAEGYKIAPAQSEDPLTKAAAGLFFAQQDLIQGAKGREVPDLVEGTLGKIQAKTGINIPLIREGTGKELDYFAENPASIPGALAGELLLDVPIGLAASGAKSTVKGGIRTIGRSPISPTDLTEKAVRSGAKNFPTYPGEKSVDEFVRIAKKFTPEELAADNRGKVVLKHASPTNFKKDFTVTQGSSEYAGMFLGPEVSPHFLRVGQEAGERGLSNLRPLGYSTIKKVGSELKEGNIKGAVRQIKPSKPTILTTKAQIDEIPSGLGTDVMDESGERILKGGSEFLQKNIDTGKAYLPAKDYRTPEMEALVGEGSRLVKKQSDFFTKYGAEKIPINEYELMSKEAAQEVGERTGKEVLSPEEFGSRIAKRSSRKVSDNVPVSPIISPVPSKGDSSDLSGKGSVPEGPVSGTEDLSGVSDLSPPRTPTFPSVPSSPVDEDISRVPRPSYPSITPPSRISPPSRIPRYSIRTPTRPPSEPPTSITPPSRISPPSTPPRTPTRPPSEPPYRPTPTPTNQTKPRKPKIETEKENQKQRFKEMYEGWSNKWTNPVATAKDFLGINMGDE